MNCVKCNNKIPYRIDIGGKLKVVAHNRRLCFTCSPWQYKSTKIDKQTCKKVCLRCSKQLPNERRNYCHSCNVIRSRQRKKSELVSYKGGKCQVCGYDKYIGNLVFHHTNPSTKKFSITSAMEKPMASLKQEADQCVLVCCRCHGEIHGKIIDITFS